MRLIEVTLHVKIGGWDRGRYQGATGYILSLLWCSIYNDASYKVCSNAG